MSEWKNANTRKCGEICGILSKLQRAGANISDGLYRATTGKVLREALRVYRDNNLWLSLPTIIGGETRAVLHAELGALIDSCR